MKPTGLYKISVQVTLASLMVAPCLPGATLSDLASRATAIVMGTVTTRSETPEGVAFDITVERVLSGNAAAKTVHVQHAWSGSTTGMVGTFDATFHGMWFLRQNAAGQWDALVTRSGISAERLFVPSLVAPLPATYAYGDNTTLEDGMVFEAAAGLQSPGQAPEVLLDLLGTMDDAAVQTVLGAYVSSPVAAVKAIGLAGFLRRGHQGALTTLTQIWPSITNEVRRTYVLSALRNFWRDATPTSIQQLVSVAESGSGSSELREPAVRALAAIHSREALPFLATLLSSADAAERLQGIFALASFANGCPMQTNDNVVSMAYLHCGQPSTYRNADTLAHFAVGRPPDSETASAVAFWQNWWGEHPELH